MYPTFFIFFILLFIIVFPSADAGTETIRGYLLAPEGQAGGNNEDEIIAEDNEPVELNPETVAETTETVGGVEVALTQEVQFVASNNDVVVLKNTAEPSISVEIPDGAFVSAPDDWNGELNTPETVQTASATISGNFLTPTSAILVGSPDVILVFNQPVTIILEDTTGTTAYKTPGSTEWIIISGCTGTYENPDDPPVNGECSISDGTDTKIVTFHFTEFTPLEEVPTDDPTDDPVDTPTTSSSSKGGSGNTNVGSPRIFGPSSSGSSGGYHSPTPTGQLVFPVWFDDVTDWYKEGKISATEFLHAYQWILDNVLK